MNFLIQTINGQVRHDFSFTLMESIRYQNWLDNRMSYETTDGTISKKHKDFIPVGSVEFVSAFLSVFYGLTPKPKNVPEELFGYAGREIFNTGSRCIESEMGLRRFDEGFVKSNDKIKGYSGIIHTGDIIPEGNYQTSEYIEIESEYRCFVFKGELVGIQYYSGDFTIFPNVDTIKEMILAYKSAPVAYTLDVAVVSLPPTVQFLTNEETLVIEVHDFFSCGLYGFANHKILPFMFSQWFYEFIKNTKQ